MGILLRPTVASILALVRQAFACGLDILGLQRFGCKALNRMEAGVGFPTDGFILHTSVDFSIRLRELTKRFSGTHSIRKAADLAKPLSQ